MGHVLYWAYQPYKWLIFAPLMLLITTTCALLAFFLSFINVKLASFIGGACWSRIIAFITPVAVSVKGSENIDRSKSYIIVANHQSIYDIFVLYGWLGIDFKWIMRKELRKIPLVGLSCEKIGHIFIDRSNSAAALKSIQIAKEKVNQGISIIFFPEGTRSSNGELGKFKPGAFKMARDLEIPIIPITINGTGRILPTKTSNLMPGRVEMIIHKPIEASTDDKELKQKAFDVISSALTS